ncbi:MAG TPA: hypothetical protein DDW52_11400 [Planctomycetaceae bacterium]|nr:hypothetical protein [Planctomycetaceae bacterium]
MCGGFAAIWFKPEGQVESVPLGSDQDTFVLDAIPSPGDSHQFGLKLNLRGPSHYIDLNPSSSSSTLRTQTRSLAYERKYSIVVTDHNGRTIEETAGTLEREKERSQGPYQSDSETFTAYRAEYEFLPEFDAKEPIRIELKLWPDTKFQSRLESGELVFETSRTSVASSIGLLVAFVGFFALIASVGITLIKLVLSLIRNKVPAHEHYQRTQRSIQK